MDDEWFNEFLISPDRAHASKIAVRHSGAKVSGANAETGWEKDPERCAVIADKLAFRNLPGSIAWTLLALESPADEVALRSVIDAARQIVVASENKLRSSALDALKIWRAIADGTVSAYGTDLFAAVQSESVRRRRRADLPAERVHPDPSSTRVVIDVLTCENWDEACETAIAAVDAVRSPLLEGMADWMTSRILNAYRHNRAESVLATETIIQRLTSDGLGAHALAFQLLLCDSARPHTFWPVYPVLAQLHELEMLPITDVEDSKEVASAIMVARLCAEGVYVEDAKSLFELTRDLLDEPRFAPPPSKAPRPALKAKGPSLVVVRDAPKLNSHTSEYKDLIGAHVPLTVARDVDGVRRQLAAEYPHALRAVDLLCRDLREGEAIRLAPVMLLGPPGTGKSRMGRRLAELVGAKTYRYDAASSSDSMFGGSPKAWGNTVPSVPARAVAFGNTANPVVLIDELEKAGTSSHNGNLWSSMTLVPRA
ncbi:MAG: ATPase central region [Lacunisphaera sp.]|nr:ATPase central region [Lacunisphaera sp.]